MRYTYAYKTSDGVRREDTMDASSREEVFSLLRERGIRPIKVVAADGSKANGEIRGVRKSVLVSSVILAILVATIGTVWIGRGLQQHGGGLDVSALPVDFDSTVRRQVIGDLAVIEKGIRTGWSEVFEHEGERFLASFAIPGMKAGLRNTTIEEITDALARSVAMSKTDSIEVRQIKAMVKGMKAEARRYISAGGTVVGYGKRLTERQDAEIAAYNRIKAEIEVAKGKMSKDQFESFCDNRNDELRNLGIRPVVPDD